VKKACTEYTKAMDKVVEAKKKYCQVLNDIVKDREKQSDVINTTKDKKTKEIFSKEHDDILDAKEKTFKEESQLASKLGSIK
jgi:hypothetical protein